MRPGPADLLVAEEVCGRALRFPLIVRPRAGSVKDDAPPVIVVRSRRSGAAQGAARSIHSTPNAHIGAASTSTPSAAPTEPRVPCPVARKSDTIVAK